MKIEPGLFVFGPANLRRNFYRTGIVLKIF
jgi:hypothetical protein